MAKRSPLHAAAEAGDLTRVQALVAAGADIDERQYYVDYGSCTPLLHAVEKGHVTVTRYLIERGADKEATNWVGKTPLVVAAMEGHIEVVRMLIEHGVNKEAAICGGLTALMHACVYGHVAVVEYLLEQGCDVDHVDNCGDTALHIAARKGHFEVAQLLLRWGAKLDVWTRKGELPVDLASQYGNHDIAAAINAEETRRREDRVRPAADDDVYSEDWSLSPVQLPPGTVNRAHTKVSFDFAIGSGNYIGEQALLAFPQIRRQRSTPHTICLGSEITAVAVKERVHLYVQPSDPPKLLNLTEPVDAAAVLIAFDVLPFLGDAVIVGFSDVLLHFGTVLVAIPQAEREEPAPAVADESPQHKQPSPLHAAVEAGDLTTVQALVAAGADIEERHMFAEEADIEKRHGDKYCPPTPLYRAAEKGRAAVARYLVERGADKEAAASDSRTPLIVAAYKGHTKVVQMLIEHGANKEAADSYGWTPLIWAASCYGRAAVVEYLLEQGCDVDHTDMHGLTSLHAAALGGHLEVAQLLLRFGAMLDLRNRYGRTPADLAIFHDHHAIADAIGAEKTRRETVGILRMLNDAISAPRAHLRCSFLAAPSYPPAQKLPPTRAPTSARL